MKIRCPRCHQKFNVSDQWGGKTIRCSACNNPFTIPKPVEVAAPLPGAADLDLESLAKLEVRTGGMEDEELLAAEAEAGPAEGDPLARGMRECPNCKKRVVDKDPYVELLCSNCWKPIPATKKGSGLQTGNAVLVGYSGGGRFDKKIGFYEGIGSANAYPIGALGSLLAAIGIAVGTVLLPVSIATALQRSVEQSNVGTAEGVKEERLTTVEAGVTIFFWAQVLFFAAVGMHAFLDVTRTSAIGEEKPPPLVWNPSAWGESILGYIVLLVYYGLFFAVAMKFAGKGGWQFPSNEEEFKQLLTPGVLGIAAVLTFFVPMTLIGMATGKLTQAISPGRVLRSIGATHVNYLFLFLIVTVYMCIYVAMFAAVLKWFSTQIRLMQRAAAEGNLVSLALSLLSWGIVMGIGFYFVYVVGRLHGLFARTFAKKLEFTS